VSVADVVTAYDLTADYLLKLVAVGALSIVALILLCAWIQSGRRLDDLVEVDHDRCPVDGCGRVLCYCRTDTACRGAEDPCRHNEPVCDEHRLDGCLGCRLDAMDDAGLLG